MLLRNREGTTQGDLPHMHGFTNKTYGTTRNASHGPGEWARACEGDSADEGTQEGRNQVNRIRCLRMSHVGCNGGRHRSQTHQGVEGCHHLWQLCDCHPFCEHCPNAASNAQASWPLTECAMVSSFFTSEYSFFSPLNTLSF